MRFVETDISGVFLVELEPFLDERGSFARTWCAEEFAARFLASHLAQCSVSRNTRRGTLRGMHYQRPPHEEAKLVRCTQGAIYDVALDLRPGSDTYLRWRGVELTAETGTGLYIPEGCAHGFQTLVDDTAVEYYISTAYAPAAATGVRWDDPAFAIGWPDAERRTISERDLAWPDFDAGSPPV